MRETSQTYKTLLAEDHAVEVVLVVGNYDMNNDTVPSGRKFTDSEIFSMSSRYVLFDGNAPTAGCTVAGQLDVTLLIGSKKIPKMAKLSPWIKLTGEIEGVATESEWIKKGEFFVDTREVTHNDDGLDVLTIHAYDAMLKTQADYPSDNHTYPALDTYIVSKIASTIGVAVDARTWDVMTGSQAGKDYAFTYGLPLGYSMQEVLSSIAIPYAGNWIITEEGELRLVSFADIPKETNLLLDNVGHPIVFGYDNGDPVRILV